MVDDHGTMKHATMLFLLLGATGLYAGPAGPAFAGLRTIQSQPYAGTSKVVEIRGERGDPQPAEWTLLLRDTSARGGVRELTVVNGRITAERTPLRAPAEVAALVPMESEKLKVDADAVFRTAQREAERSRIGFNWIDYTLRNDPATNAPVWTAGLYDHMGAPLATMKISATGGEVVQPLQAGANSRTLSEATTPGRPVGGLVGDVGTAAETAVKRTKNSALRFVGSLQEAFVGERTIGPKEEE